MRKLLAMILLGVASSVALVVSIKPAAADPALLNDGAVTQTFQQSGFSARSSIHGQGQGWAIEDGAAVPNQDDHTVDQEVVWPLDSPLAPPEHGRNVLLDFILSCTSVNQGHSLGHFRLSYTLDSNPDLNSTFVPMTPDAIVSTDPGITFSLVNQDILVGGTNPNQAIYEVQFVLSDIPSAITGFLLEVFDENGRDDADFNGLPTGGPGRASNGNFILTHVTVNFFYVIPARRLPPIFERGRGSRR